MIKTHKDLAEIIAGKRVLHLNSFGKDSAATLVWLENTLAETISLNFKFLAFHPDDEKYLKYLKKRFQSVEFVSEPNAFELTSILNYTYQSPIDCLLELNSWEHSTLEHFKYVEEMRLKYRCDYVAIGMSKYESVSRAMNFYKKGLLQGTNIYPLGLLDKAQVLKIATSIKLHPSYKLAPSTYDFPSYYKMRSAFINYPQYYETIKSIFPMIELDKYRYEFLFKME